VREVEIDKGMFELGMSQQRLDGAQIGAGLEQVAGVAVPAMSPKK